MTIKQMVEEIIEAHLDMAIHMDPDALRKAVYKFTYWMDQLGKELEKRGVNWEGYN